MGITSGGSQREQQQRQPARQAAVPAMAATSRASSCFASCRRHRQQRTCLVVELGVGQLHAAGHVLGACGRTSEVPSPSGEDSHGATWPAGGSEHALTGRRASAAGSGAETAAPDAPAWLRAGAWPPRDWLSDGGWCCRCGARAPAPAVAGMRQEWELWLKHVWRTRDDSIEPLVVVCEGREMKWDGRSRWWVRQAAKQQLGWQAEAGRLWRHDPNVHRLSPGASA